MALELQLIYIFQSSGQKVIIAFFSHANKDQWGENIYIIPLCNFISLVLTGADYFSTKGGGEIAHDFFYTRPYLSINLYLNIYLSIYLSIRIYPTILVSGKLPLALPLLSADSPAVVERGPGQPSPPTKCHQTKGQQETIRSLHRYTDQWIELLIDELRDGQMDK